MPTSALGQCLLAQRMGLSAVIADTGSGENGVATAAVAAQLGLACRVFIGSRDAAKIRWRFDASSRLARRSRSSTTAAPRCTLR